ncbi:BrnT family toxin [Candidatus Dojkabacteria bacterium]|nr:BrnT family toxin [Candidatus Dojkabacteria bacterium]
MEFNFINGFDWDSGNIEKNWERHEVSFIECEQAFFNFPIRFQYDTKHSQKENRYILFGKTDKERFLIIVFTIREDKVRVISARDQNIKERLYYLGDIDE